MRNISGNQKYVFILIFCAIFLSLYKFPDSLDIVKYYESVKYAVNTNISFIDYVIDTFNYNIDFVYFSSLFLFGRLGIDLNFVTWLYISTYFCLIVKCSDEFAEKRYGLQTLIPFIGLFCVPLDWVISISRTVAAITFLYIAIISYQKERLLKCFVFLIISFFTHFLMILFISIFVVSIVLGKLKIKPFISNIILICFVFVGLVPEILADKVSLIFSIVGGETRYGEQYTELMKDMIPILQQSGVDYGSKLVALITYLVSISFALIDKNRNFMYWGLYIGTILLVFFFHSSLMMVHRTMLYLPIFISASAFSILKTYSNKRSVYKKMKNVGLLYVFSFIIVLYAAREIFF